MVKNHLKRTAAPRTWPLPRKLTKFVIRPNAGAHSFMNGAPLVIIIRDMLKLVKSMREANELLKKDQVLVNKMKVRDPATIVGLMDIIEFPAISQQYVIIIDTKKKLSLKAVKDIDQKFCQVAGKHMVRTGKMQIRLSDGHNMLLGKNSYNTHDTLIVSLPDYKIKEHLPMQNGMKVYLTGGNHTGELGTLENIQGNTAIVLKEDGKKIDVPEDYLFVVGKDKPAMVFEETKTAKESNVKEADTKESKEEKTE